MSTFHHIDTHNGFHSPFDPSLEPNSPSNHNNISWLNNIGNTFYKKVKLLKSVGRLSDHMEILLLEINKTRNKIAHNIDFELTFERIFELANLANSAKVDFSDSTICCDYQLAKEYFGIENSIKEIFGNLFYDILDQNSDLFPDEEHYSYMT